MCFISSPARTSASSQLIHMKEVMLGGKKASFVDKAEELTLHLSDALDRCAKWVFFFHHTEEQGKFIFIFMIVFLTIWQTFI